MNPAVRLLSAGAQPATSARLRVLVLDEYFPFPPASGKPIRSWNLLRRLAQRHEITFLCHGRLTAEQESAAREAKIRVETVDAIPPDAGLPLYAKLFANLFSPYPYSVDKHFTARFQDKLRALLGETRFDAIHCEWTPYARYVMEERETPIIVATHNIESQIWQRRAEHAGNPLSRWFFAQQASKMEAFESAALSRAAMVTAVSKLDMEQAQRWGARAAMVVDNGVDLERFVPSGHGADQLAVFVGALDWFPNVDAAHYFADEIQPELRKIAPQMKVRIIGRNAPEALRAAMSSRPGVEFAGEVPDTRPHLTEAGLVIVPLRIGGGSRLKILEALAMGKAVVSTSVGAEGLEVTDGKHILLADTPSAFAQAMKELAAAPELREELGRNGRRLVEQRYGWDALSLKAEAAWMATTEVRK